MKLMIAALLTLGLVSTGCTNAEFEIDDAVNSLIASGAPNGPIANPPGGPSSPGGQGPTDPNNPTPNPERTLAEIIAEQGQLNEHNEVVLPQPAIEQLCRSRSRMSHHQDIRFEPPGQTCEWNVNGNLGLANYFLQARIEQVQPLGIPPDALLCSMKLNFPAQTFLYDDHFIFNLNRTVVASSYNWESILDIGSNGLYTYNWLDIRGNVWDTGEEVTYCADVAGAASHCTFPDSDTPGIIDLELSNRHVESAMATGLPLAGHYFQMVTIGDNDELDCEHTGINFTVDVEYIR